MRVHKKQKLVVEFCEEVWYIRTQKKTKSRNSILLDGLTNKIGGTQYERKHFKQNL